MSSGAYQSKLFNVLTRQSLRLRQQAGQAWRWSRVAVVWSVQIALYPVYVAFQSVRLLGKQLQQTSQRTQLRLRSAWQSMQNSTPAPAPLSADTPIWHVLQAAESLSLQGEPLSDRLPGSTQSTPALPSAQNESQSIRSILTQKQAAMASSATSVAPVPIQGIASLLTTRSLVLVTTGNGILDILTPEQQSALARRIVGEMAIYWREQRLAGYAAGRLASPFVSRYLPLPQDRPNALPPIRSLWQTMGWMQRGAVAISVNLFQEAKLAWHRSTPHALPGSPSLKSAQPVWMEMEAQFYETLSRASQRTGLWLLQTLRAGTQALSQLAPNASALTPRLPAAASLRATPSWIERLDRWLSRVSGPNGEPPVAPKPWLTMEDLFGPVKPVEINRVQGSSVQEIRSTAGSLPQATASIMPTASWEGVDTALLETLTKNQAKHALDSRTVPSLANAATQQPASLLHGTHPMTQPRLREPIEHTPTALSEDKIAATDTAETIDPDLLPASWIDTKAELVTYEKHPLERLLEWLDRGMLWIEERVAQVWRWLRRQFG
ncbi:MAG: hypothetical protein IGS50_16850 [Synechococcales cyanobacterium C42_A2020_086]|jgi:hypothetical protein|nr:hypothetical protein [Synechococcales cyanobacterium C42_A2020_086]